MREKREISCILICQKADCWLEGGKEVYHRLEEELRDRGLSDRVQLQKTRCLKQCHQAPNLVIMPARERHGFMKLSQVGNLLNRYF
jgi:NADH:ubiquinone oxidoreductase subunit E